MRIKKYISKSLAEGKKLVTEELGNDAVILSTRTTKNSKSGENEVEIVAAVDKKVTKRPQSKNSPGVPAKASAIEQKLNTLLEKIDSPLSPYLDERLKRVYNYLKKLGFDESYTGSFIKDLSANSDIPEDDNQILDLLITKIKTENLFKKRLTRKVYNFCGPPGSGKSSLILKFAVLQKVLNDSDILIIGNQINKFGAKEVMESYCKALDIDFQGVSGGQKPEQILRNSKDKDIILIESGEHSSQNAAINKIEKAESILTLPSIYDRKVLENYLSLDYDFLALTFTDKLNKFSNIFHLIEKSSESLVFFSCGPVIPDDIEKVDYEGIKRLITNNGR